MKKLRCENCGGELEIDEQQEYATCNYCKTKYKLNDDKTVTIKLDDDLKEMYTDAYNNSKKIMKPMFIIVPIIMIVIFGMMIFGMTRGIGESDKSSFNFTYEANKGTKYNSSVMTVLDKASTNNQTNKRKITVVYDNKEYVDSNDIIELKRLIDDGSMQNNLKRYEIKLEYDSKGYVNKIIIEDIN